MPLGDSAESMGAFVWIEATSPAGGGKDSRRTPEGAGEVAADPAVATFGHLLLADSLYCDPNLH